MTSDIGTEVLVRHFWKPFGSGKSGHAKDEDTKRRETSKRIEEVGGGVFIMFCLRFLCYAGALFIMFFMQHMGGENDPVLGWLFK